ncbi:MAG TPA: SDR family oxidoreductase [Armatimonadota bacterium]|nr:SDR family oxidoreductase [Armatimonadota bacterium]
MRIRLKPLREQVVVVMGASSGIGRETALRLAERGARLVVSARESEALRGLEAELRARGGEARAIPCDVSEWEQVRAVAEGAAEAFGRIDTWILMAGVGLWATLEQTTPEEWDRLMAVNANGQFYGARAALPHLRRAGGGALVHVSSVEADATLPFQSAYAASKHAVHAMLETLRMELQAEGVPISVTEIKPYGISTPLFDNAATKIGTKPQPLPPLYHPALAAEAVVYATEHPVPELTVGGVGRASVLGERYAPGIADSFLRRAGPRGQRTDEPRPPEFEGNLFRTANDSRVEGSLTPKARRTSLYTWLSLHPGIRMAAAGAALGAAAMLLMRAGRPDGAVSTPDAHRAAEELPEAVYAGHPT